MKNKFMAAVLLLFARRSQLTAFSILRFLIPDSRFGFLRAIPLLTATLLVIITFPLHAATPGFDTLVNYDTAWTYVYDGGKYKDGTAMDDYFNDVK
jgi:hypothetical protein